MEVETEVRGVSGRDGVYIVGEGEAAVEDAVDCAVGLEAGGFDCSLGEGCKSDEG